MTSNTAPSSTSDALALLDRRRSTPARTLSAPGPDDAELDRLLRSAIRVPDHGKLTPWRLLAVRGDSRDRLGELVAERQRRRSPEATAAMLDKDRRRFSHAPLVLIVICSPRETDRIPEQEQLLSAGCVCFALLQAAQALGFGAQWLTGWPAYDSEITERLGLAAHERIVGFIHVGTPTCEPIERARPEPSTLLAEWTP